MRPWLGWAHERPTLVNLQDPQALVGRKPRHTHHGVAATYLVQVLQPCYLNGMLRKVGELVWLDEPHFSADAPYRHGKIIDGRMWFPQDPHGPEQFSSVPIARFGADVHDDDATAWR